MLRHRPRLGYVEKTPLYVKMSDRTKFPKEFGTDLGGMRFIDVYRTNDILVDFTVNKMKDCTGFFKVWHEYCVKKIKVNGI